MTNKMIWSKSYPSLIVSPGFCRPRVASHPEKKLQVTVLKNSKRHKLQFKLVPSSVRRTKPKFKKLLLQIVNRKKLMLLAKVILDFRAARASFKRKATSASNPLRVRSDLQLRPTAQSKTSEHSMSSVVFR